MGEAWSTTSSPSLDGATTRRRASTGSFATPGGVLGRDGLHPRPVRQTPGGAAVRMGHSCRLHRPREAQPGRLLRGRRELPVKQRTAHTRRVESVLATFIVVYPSYMSSTYTS